MPGDGVGPEVTAEGRKVLEAIASSFGHDFEFSEQPVGGCSIDAHGTALTDEVLDACRAADAVFLGAVGGPKWDDPTADVRPEQGLLRLRSELGLYANLRPVQIFPELVQSSPLRPEPTCSWSGSSPAGSTSANRDSAKTSMGEFVPLTRWSTPTARSAES